MDGWMDGWLAGWLDGWMDGWIDWYILLDLPLKLHLYHESFRFLPCLFIFISGNVVVLFYLMNTITLKAVKLLKHYFIGLFTSQIKYINNKRSDLQ